MASLASLFGSLTGSTQSNAVKDATALTQKGILDAYNLGKPLIEGGYSTANSLLGLGSAQANDFLTQGYGTASGTLQGGLQNAWGALNNAGTATSNYLNQGYGQARSDLSSLYDQARGANNAAVDKISGYYQPYMQSGQQAQGLYDQFLGLQGADAAKTAATNFAGNDPGIQYRMDMLDKQSQQRANAAGYLGSNREAMARNRAQSEMLSQDYQAYLNRLADQAGKGGQYAQQLSGFTDAAAGRTAALYGRQGDQMSALSQAQARDLGQNERQHATSLVDLISGTAGRQAGLDSNYYGGLADNTKGFAGQMATNAIGQGTTLANLGMGKETALANAGAQGVLGNAQASAQGLNNLISLGTLGTSLYNNFNKPKQQDAQVPVNTTGGNSSFWNLFS